MPIRHRSFSLKLTLRVLAVAIGLLASTLPGCEGCQKAVGAVKQAGQLAADVDRDLRRPLTKKRLQAFLRVTPNFAAHLNKTGVSFPRPGQKKGGAPFSATDFDHLKELKSFFLKDKTLSFAQWLTTCVKLDHAQQVLSSLEARKAIKEGIGKSGTPTALRVEEVRLVNDNRRAIDRALALLPN